MSRLPGVTGVLGCPRIKFFSYKLGQRTERQILTFDGFRVDLTIKRRVVGCKLSTKSIFEISMQGQGWTPTNVTRRR